MPPLNRHQWPGEEPAPREALKGLSDRMRTQGGFTVNVETGEHPTSGFSVADHGREETHLPGERRSHAHYVQKNIGALSQPGKYFGGWRETGEGGKPKMDYFDTSSVYPASKAGKTQARLGSFANNQKAHYSLHEGVEEENPGYEGDAGAQARRMKRMQGRNVTGPAPKQLPRTQT